MLTVEVLLWRGLGSQWAGHLTRTAEGHLCSTDVLQDNGNLLTITSTSLTGEQPPLVFFLLKQICDYLRHV